MPASNAPPRRAGAREWCFRIGLVILAPLVFFGLAEAGLRIGGYGYPTSFFVPRAGGETYTTNRRFGWQFYPRSKATEPYPVVLPAHKQPGTIRVFVLGESAAAGTPDPAFGFARILEVMLQRQFPGTRFEVINAAMRGINSHIIRRIARECARFEPDLFLVYAGNNEAVGVYSPEPGRARLAKHLRLVRVIQSAKSTRLAQLVESILERWGGTQAEARPEDMAFFRSRRWLADDPQRQPIYKNFRANLEDICRAAHATGAKVLLSTVAVNLKDFAPLGSLHRPGFSEADRAAWDTAYAQGIAAEAAGAWPSAIAQFRKAEQLDDHFADLHYRLARCCQAAGLAEEARRHFTLARDWDALQFRTDSTLNQVIRETAARFREAGVRLVDTERAFSGTNGVPGADLFLDHVHFNFDGDYRVAKTLLIPLVDCLGLGTTPKELPSRAECAEALAFTHWDELNVRSAMLRMTAQPPFLDQIDHALRQSQDELTISNRLSQFDRAQLNQALAVSRAALAQRPDDWQIHYNRGGLLAMGGDTAGAVQEYQAALAKVPEFLALRLTLGETLLQAGRAAEARRTFEGALEEDPNSVPAREGWTRASRWH